jgi:lipoprotein-anchoring transpeptidase ErfK/SrfK
VRTVTPVGTSGRSRTILSRYRWSIVGTPQTVGYDGGQRPGTIVVDIDERFLYLVEGDGTAMRYAIGVGRQGFAWRGAAYVGRKSVWPNWSPTSNMVRLIPDLPRYASAGVDNPLGARALPLPGWPRYPLPHPRHQ